MTDESQVLAVHVRAFVTRLIALSAIFALAVLSELGLGAEYSERQRVALYALVGLGFALTLAYGALGFYGRQRTSQLGGLIGDGLLISALVYCAGGAASVYCRNARSVSSWM